MLRIASIVVIVLATTCVHVVAGDPPVEVIVDMDASQPGIQSTVYVPACTEVVADIAVYVRDPLGKRSVWSIGYLGGIDRGIAFGHMPDALNAGSVMSLNANVMTPVNPGNTAFIWQDDLIDPGFIGPEVQYVEAGASSLALIGVDPKPIFVASVTLSDALPGDRFGFYLLDFVTVWTGGTGGAFSVSGGVNSLDTGGDAVPDATATLYGVDPDVAIPVPPGAYQVDFIDGPPNTGPAVIEVLGTSGDLDMDGSVDVNDLLMLLAQWGPCTTCSADLDGDGDVDTVDLLMLLGAWSECV